MVLSLNPAQGTFSSSTLFHLDFHMIKAKTSIGAVEKDECYCIDLWINITRSSIRNILLALDIGDGCRQV